MPKVGSYRLRGTPKDWLDIDISYNGREKVFYIKIPEYLKVFHGTKGTEEMFSYIKSVREWCVWGKDYDKAVSNAQHIYNLYLETKTVREKVVLYGYQIGDAFNHDWGWQKQSLSLKYMVAEKLTVAGKVMFLNEQGREVMSGGSGHIPWTEKREEFFREVTSAFEQLSERVKLFFEKEAALINYIDNNQKLLER